MKGGRSAVDFGQSEPLVLNTDRTVLYWLSIIRKGAQHTYVGIDLYGEIESSVTEALQ